ncbi:MAG: Aminotransferase class I and II [uncultured bacterium (gcode 4)]|uniref:Aminotransferase class I and II n=1 Tax=uncultured bacterium (gcode 4) TaxID=1234023 RepID=K2FD21_9BACT|nr:MAG: Aminotransferase class I and II [uncultured bacterium (gcode 4)]
MSPELSNHLKSTSPSSIRLAQIEFSKRKDNVKAINVAIWNVSLPMHPAMQKRMFSLVSENSPFKDWIVKYTASVWESETQDAFFNILKSSGIDTSSLFCHIVDWWSMAMELVVIWICWEAGIDERPLLVIDAAYTNYASFAQRTGRKIVSVKRKLDVEWNYSFPSEEEINEAIREHDPAWLVIIPYDNPTGHLYKKSDIINLSRICVENNMWIISDEAYRELHYDGSESVSIWKLSDEDVSWIEWRRISIETSSKVWNACWLRIWAIITDNKQFHEQVVAEYTANLCANSIWQYIFGSLAHEKTEDLQNWYKQQKSYYSWIMNAFYEDLKKELPWIIISKPQAALYSVLDFKNITKAWFDSKDFVLFSAQKWSVELWGTSYTLLIAPMDWFYNVKPWEPNPGKTQARVAFVETRENFKLIPNILKRLIEDFEKQI